MLPSFSRVLPYFLTVPADASATQEDELGELYLTNMDFLINGVPASIIATLVSSITWRAS
jgi:hypothetical protein